MGRPGADNGGTGGFRPASPNGQSRPPLKGSTPAGRPPSGKPPNGIPPAGRPPLGRSSAGRSSAGKNDRPPAGRPQNGRVPGPPVGRPPVPQRGGRYAPPRSPKRPGSSNRNNGCGNIIIGGVVVLIIVFIILMNVLRSSCTGCVNGTESDVSDSVDTTQSSESTTVSDTSSSTSSEPPKKPVPVLTLVKNEPSKPFDDECVIDELKWFDDPQTTGADLKFFYDKLGVQPYVVFKKYDPSLKTNEDKVRHCVEWFKANNLDDDAFLLMYFAERASSSDVGYTVYYSGANAEKLAIQFKGILEEGINEYWFTDLSTDDVIKYAFEYTCDRITVITADELLQPDRSEPSEASDSTDTSEPEADDTSE